MTGSMSGKFQLKSLYNKDSKSHKSFSQSLATLDKDKEYKHWYEHLEQNGIFGFAERGGF
jgi:hypothetical protein